MYWRRSSRELCKNCTVCLSWYMEGRIVWFLLFCFPVFRKFTSWFLGHTWVWFHLWLSPVGLCCKCCRLAVSIGSLCSGDHCCPNCSLWKMSVLKGLEHKVETVVMFVKFTGWWEPAYRDGIWRGGLWFNAWILLCKYLGYFWCRVWKRPTKWRLGEYIENPLKRKRLQRTDVSYHLFIIFEFLTSWAVDYL